MEEELISLAMMLLSHVLKNPWGPVTAGAALTLLGFLAFRGPLKERVNALLTTDARKRAAVSIAALIPAVVSVLNEAAAWDKALGTALLSVLVSQGLFLLVKGAKPPSAGPMIGLLLVVNALVGCSGAQSQIAMVEDFAEASRDVLTVAEPCLAAQREQALKECKGDAICEAKVVEVFDRIGDQINIANDIWCKLMPKGEGCS